MAAARNVKKNQGKSGKKACARNSATKEKRCRVYPPINLLSRRAFKQSEAKIMMARNDLQELRLLRRKRSRQQVIKCIERSIAESNCNLRIQDSWPTMSLVRCNKSQRPRRITSTPTTEGIKSTATKRDVDNTSAKRKMVTFATKNMPVPSIQSLMATPAQNKQAFSLPTLSAKAKGLALAKANLKRMALKLNRKPAGKVIATKKQKTAAVAIKKKPAKAAKLAKTTKPSKPAKVTSQAKNAKSVKSAKSVKKVCKSTKVGKNARSAKNAKASKSVRRYNKK